MTATNELELTTMRIADHPTAYLATELAILAGSGERDAAGWLRYHAIIDTLCKRHPEVEAAWEAWADACDMEVPARERMPSSTAVLAAVQSVLTPRPLYTVKFDNGEIFETSYPTEIPNVVIDWAEQGVGWVEIAGPDIDGMRGPFEIAIVAPTS